MTDWGAVRWGGGDACGASTASTSSTDSRRDDSLEGATTTSVAVCRGDREARRDAEKRRRTQLNGAVAELAAMLPLVAESARKVDKTGVLRLAAHEMRKEHVFGDAVERSHSGGGGGFSSFGLDAAAAALDLFDAFLVAATARGVVVVVSPNVRALLGREQIDMLGRSLFEIVHADDARALERGLDPDAGPARRDFVVRLARGGTGDEPSADRSKATSPRWCPCRFVGGFKRADRATSPSSSSSDAPPALAAAKRRARRDRRLRPADNDSVMIALATPLDGRAPPAPSPAPPTRLVEASHDEYWTRHLVDGRIVHCDRRISLVAGYFSDEVTGASAFTFIHKEDVRWVMIALRQMYDQNKPFGESCYRLVARTGRFIYLRTRGYLEVDEATKEAKSFVCINSTVRDEDGARMIDEMKRRYSALVQVNVRRAAAAVGAEGVGSPEDAGPRQLEDPRRLEEAIMHLITNLPSPASASPCPSPLSIIPPTADTVKTAIERSMTLVKGKRPNGASSPNGGGLWSSDDDDERPPAAKRAAIEYPSSNGCL